MKTPMKIITPWLPFGWHGMATPFMVFIRKGHDTAKIWAHEMVHIEQFKRIGYLNYMWRYFTNFEFRVSVESEAYGPDISVEWIKKRYKKVFLR